MAEAAAEAPDQHEAELQQPVGEAADIHQVGRQDEQRDREQHVAVEQAVEDLLGGGAEIEPRQQQIEDRGQRSSSGRSAGRARRAATIAMMQSAKGLSGMVNQPTLAGSVVR